MRKGLVVGAAVGGVLVVLVGAASTVDGDATQQRPLERQRTLKTRLVKRLVEPLPQIAGPVPDEHFRSIEFDGPQGKLRAWVTQAPTGATRSPAIVWIAGGFPPGGFPDPWLEQDPANDQSAIQFMQAGVITLYATTRGMAGNSGVQESFLGEVADVVAAVEWLRQQPEVDPSRVYIGGHSTGATLALLVSASTQVAGVIALGPLADIEGYGAERLAFDPNLRKERSVRSPRTYSRLFPPGLVLEGEWGNASSVRSLSRAPSPGVSYVVLPNHSHFSYLSALNEALARRIARSESLQLSEVEAVSIIAERFPPTVVRAPDGWSITVPASYIDEREPTTTGHFFTAPMARLVVSFEDANTISCESKGAVKTRGGSCFLEERGPDGALAFTAQLGPARFISIMGHAELRARLKDELSAIISTAKAP